MATNHHQYPNLLRGIHGKPLDYRPTRPGFRAPWGHMDPHQATSSAGVFKGLTLFLVFCCGTYAFFTTAIAPKPPRTLSKQWQAKQDELRNLEKAERGF